MASEEYDKILKEKENRIKGWFSDYQKIVNEKEDKLKNWIKSGKDEEENKE